LWVIFPLLDPDLATQINADPDPEPWLVHKTMVNGKSGNRARALTRTPHKNMLTFSYLKNEVENNQVVLEEDEGKLLQEREEQLRGGNTKAETEIV
jgi:hypothetical protein